MLKYLAILLIFYIFSIKNAIAIYDPLSVPNNRFGIHIIDENDLDDAAQLLNSSKGDWGYVKIVIREDDRNIDKWQEVFDRMRQKHLIPIVRLATRVENGAWSKPKKEDITRWVEFLHKLNWVTENRYIVLFNEPNHAKEWGNALEPEEYGELAKEFSKRLKQASPDFFVLPAGLDASAPQTHETLDELVFLRRMLQRVPDFFDHMDGWSSHSYPNPGFSGTPYDTGRGTVRTWQWEMSQLRSFGLNKQLPVFILETGWRHSEGKVQESAFVLPEKAAQYYEHAFQTAWSDPQIAAVVPFLLNYQDVPFDHFSWKKIGSEEFYPMYEHIQSTPKIKGTPRQYSRAKFLNSTIPSKLVNRSQYTFSIEIENNGQTIVDDDWKLELMDPPDLLDWKIGSIEKTLPFHRTRVIIEMTTSEVLGTYTSDLLLRHKDEIVTKMPLHWQIVPPPSLLVRATLWLKRRVDADDYKIVIYDKNESVVHKISYVTMVEGKVKIPELRNIIPNELYRIVVLKDFYLPRQQYVQIGESETEVAFPPLLPLDTSNDGKLSLRDILLYFKNPVAVWVRLLPSF